MVATVTQARFSFMTAGPTFDLSLPSDFESPPELSSALSNGIGGRSFDFLPTGHSNGIPENYPVIGTLTDGQGRTVEFYQWPFDPPQWYLRWALTTGSLWTHLREEDGAEMAEITVRALSIVEDSAGGTPFLAPGPPLRRAVGAHPGFQEVAMYVSTARPGWRVYLQRPAFLRPGQTVTLPSVEPDLVVIRTGGPFGIEVHGLGTDLAGVQEVVTMVSSSLAGG